MAALDKACWIYVDQGYSGSRACRHDISRGVTVESPILAQEAIDAARQRGKGGFVDRLVAKVGFANGAREVLTFDAKFGQAAKVRRLK